MEAALSRVESSTEAELLATANLDEAFDVLGLDRAGAGSGLRLCEFCGAGEGRRV